MAITLNNTIITERTLRRGEDTFTLMANKRLRIQKWDPGAVDVLDETVPEGESWAVTIVVNVVATAV